MTWFSEKEQYNCHLICRPDHVTKNLPNSIQFHGSIQDFSIFKPWKNIAGRVKVRDLVYQYDIDIIHIFYAEPNALWVSSFPKYIPIILTTRGSDVLVGLKHFISRPGIKYKILKWSYQKALNRINVITSTSNLQSEFLMSNFNLTTNPEIIRTGIETSRIQPEKKSKKIIFFPRNMKPIYDHELALQAIEMLPEEIKLNYEFVFVNKDSQDQDYVHIIEEQMAVLHMDNISFNDSLKQEAYFEILASAALVVMTPKSDGSPVSGMEAIAAGAKLILPNLNYDSDLFDLAYFYQSGQASELCQTIQNALKETTKKITSDYQLKVDRNLEMQKIDHLYDTLF